MGFLLRACSYRVKGINSLSYRAFIKSTAYLGVLMFEKWQRQNPEKRNATAILNNRIRNGQIRKPETCEACGKRAKVDGHHTDYAKPLSVRWVCRQCHKDIHRSIPRT